MNKYDYFLNLTESKKLILALLAPTQTPVLNEEKLITSTMKNFTFFSKSLLSIIFLLGIFSVQNISAQDSDADGIDNTTDLDDDNDGIPDLEEGVTCAISTNLNSPGNPINTNFAAGPTSSVTLTGLDNGTFDFSAVLSGTVTWANGVQIQNNPAIGDFLYGQPENSDNSSSANVATYTFDFPVPVKNFSFVTGGLNNNDQVTITAFIGATAINITEANFSGLDDGVFAVGNTVQGTVFDGSFDPLINIFSTFIPGNVDRVVITTGKADDLDTQVTIGLYSFSYCSSDPTADFDGDGIPNSLDLDSDNDGILDIVEAGGTDTDNDGEVDYVTPGDATTMADTNMNGLADDLDATPLTLSNSDSFLGPDFLDIDADDDGIPDNIEGQTTAGYIPPSGTGLSMTDANTNGVDDNYETNGNIGIIPVNTDASFPNSDNDADYIDDDSDGDGINDIAENGDVDNTMLGVDMDNDGLDDVFDDFDDSSIAGSTVNDGINPPDASNLGDEDGDLITGGDVDYRDRLGFADQDNDGTPDSLDLDNDNDGIPDIVEGTDDFDNDSIPNYLDLDSDNDGIPDVVEAGGMDDDRDGIIDNFIDIDDDGLNDAQDNVDNGSGIGEITTGTPLDVFNTDGNGNPDFLDIDADDDGIVDNIEAQTTGDYVPPLNADDDMDGIDNQYDVDFVGTGIYGIANTDGDPLPDYRDLDSDADLIPDLVEGWDLDADGTAEVVPGNVDADRDGLDDNFDNDIADPDPTNGQVPTDFPDAQSPGGDQDWRQGFDNDGDGILDVNDIDDDNDGILDTVEGSGDTDGDGVPDWFDLDSDNDGIPDIVEAGGADADLDGDGEVDYPGFDSSTMTDADNNGLEDRFDANPLPDEDSDNDGIENRLDLDSDNDGLPDVIEAGGTDVDGDGRIDNYADIDVDGFDNSVDTNDNSQLGALDGGTPYPYPNSDSDTIDNWLDIDSDNDGITDVTEAGGTDADGDGRIDGFTDADMDGFADSVDSDDSTTPTALDGTGTPLPNDDLDTDGNPNYIDIDSDNDGLPDNIEAQPTVGYIQPTGTFALNGLDTAYATGLIPEDTDGDLTPDYLDSDSDNDLIDDVTEGGRGTLTNVDTDGDGLDDGFEGANTNDPTDVNDEIDDPSTLPDVQLPGGDVDYREGIISTLDTDGDGVLDEQEIADGTDPNNPCDFVIASITEVQSGAYRLADCDGDGVTNETEILDGTNPEDPCDFVAANITEAQTGDYLISDCDGDGVTNGTEIGDGTDPEDPCDYIATSVTLDRSGDWLLADCDGDTISNGQEVTDGTNPEDPCSSRGGTPPAGIPCDIIIESDLVNPGVNNGVFTITNIEAYPNNTVRIYNRWGVLVFETQNYDNTSNGFQGISNGRATIKQNEALPVGIYFYVIEYVKDGVAEVKNGYLYVNR